MVRNYEAEVADKKRLTNGRYYRDCSEAERANLDSLLDLARSCEMAMMKRKEFTEAEKDYLVFTLFEPTLLNRAVLEGLPPIEQDRLYDEAEGFLKKFKAVLGKKYLESKMIQVQIGRLVSATGRPSV